MSNGRPATSGWPAWARASALIALYAAITVLVTWPAVPRLGTHLAGTFDADQVEKVWNFWTTKEALLHGQNPAMLTMAGYPSGHFSAIRLATLTMHIMLLPFELVLPPIAAYNVGFVLSFLLTGLAGYALCHDLTGNQIAAAFGGLVIMLWPQRFAQAVAGHIETAMLPFVLLYVLFLGRTLRRPSWRPAVMMGIAFALAGMMHATVLPYVLIPLTAIYVPVILATRTDRRFFDWPTWRALLMSAGVALVIILPFFVPMIAFSLNPPDYAFEGGAGLPALSTDLLGYVTPSPLNAVMNALGLVPGYAADMYGFFLPETIAYLGLAPLVLAGIAIARRDEEAKAWLLVALVAMILAMGPLLKVNGGLIPAVWNPDVPVPLPYALLSRAPIYSVGRTPGRFNLVTGIALAVIVARGIDLWLREQRPWKVGAIALAAVVMTVEYPAIWPVPTMPISEPATAAYLAAHEPDGAVLNVPGPNRYVELYGQLYQTWHHWPIVGGYSDRIVPNDPGVVEMMDWLTSPASAGDIVPAVSPTDALAMLEERGVRYVMLHRRFAESEDDTQAHLATLFGTPIAEDEQTVLYAVPESTVPTTGPVIAIAGTNWGTPEQVGSSTQRALSGAGQVIIYAPAAQPVEMTITQATGEACQLALTSNTAGPVTLDGATLVELAAGFNVYEVTPDCDAATITSIQIDYP